MDIIFAIVIYIVVCYAAAKIGEKFRVGSMLQYFIPVYNWVLICKCAKVSPWWLVAMFIPYVNLVVTVYIYGTLAERLGKNFWLNGIGSLFFCIPLFIMAWDKSMPVDALPSDHSPVTKV